MSSKNQESICEYCQKPYLATKGQRFCSNLCRARALPRKKCPVCSKAYFENTPVCSIGCVEEFNERLNNNDPEAKRWIKQFTQPEESPNPQCIKCGESWSKIGKLGTCHSCIMTEARSNPPKRISFSDSDWLCQSNDMEGDVLKCVVCGKGPFGRNERVDTENGGYQVFCSPCYQLALQ